MAGKYRLFGTLFDRIFRNDLNANFDDIDTDIKAQKTRVDNLIIGTPQPSEVVDARGVSIVLRDRLDGVDSTLAGKTTKGQIIGTDLDVSADSKRLKLSNMSDEVIQAMAGTTPVNATPGINSVTEEKYATSSASTRALANKSVTNDKVQEKSIDLNHVSVPLPYISPSKNLVDKTKLKSGVYIAYNTGLEVANATYNATELIRIKPSATYTVKPNDQSAFYDVNKVYISGLTSNGGAPNTFTAPSNAVYMRITVANANIDKVQLEEGTFPTQYATYNVPKTIDSILLKDKITDLLSHTVNPFKKTKVKLIGDSITAGVAGTGYSKTGEVMFTDSSGVVQNANIETATCWANSLKKLLETKYNGKYQWVDLTHPEIKVISHDSTLEARISSVPGYQRVYPNITAGNTMMEFTFYGDKFTIRYAKAAAYGIFDVFIDGVKSQTIDAYAASFLDMQSTEFTGLTSGNHKVELKETNTKNALATGNSIYIQGLRIPKTVIVKNWGISGWASRHLELNPDWVSSDDDFIIVQLGTNDRLYEGQTTYSYQANFIRKMRSQNRKVVLMASVPSSPSNDNRTDVMYYRNMEDEASEIRALAHDFDVPFISNHEFFINYTMFRGVIVDTLLADALHPNDSGYDLMFKNITQKLGFGCPADGVTW